MDIEKPAITHKYITLFSTEDAYNEAYSNFSEANWSDVGYPEDTPDNYRLSRRLSNMYHKDNPPDYKFNDINDKVVEQKEELKKDDDGNWQIVYRDVDIYPDAHRSSNYRLLDYSDNCIRKAFFLEVVWGYFGWEWIDYTRILEDETEEVLVGGNLYKVKEIHTIPHIIDGYRLYHINDFLNSQSAVTAVEEFNTVNLKAMNRAFMRLERKYGLNTITPLLLKVYEFPEVVEADDAFRNNKVTVVDNHTLVFPKLTSVDGLFSRSEFIDGTTIEANNLENFTNSFYFAHFTQTDFNLNNILVGDSLKKISNLSSLLELATFYNGREDNNYDRPVNTFTVDLSGSNLSETDEFNFSRFAYFAATSYSPNYRGPASFTNRIFIFNLTLKGLSNFENGFRRILDATRFVSDYNADGLGRNYNHSGPNRIILNFNNTEGLIRNLDYALAQNTFIELPPFNHWVNDYTTENYMYQACNFTEGVTYDFSPNQVLNSSEGQFNNCTISLSKTVDSVEVPLPFTFTNVDALKNVRFQNISFGTHTETIDGQTVTVNNSVPFPFVGDFHNSRYQYNEDASDLHRYINFSGSKFSSIRTKTDSSEQIIYVDGKCASTMFENCTEIDFTDKNITIDMSSSGTGGVTWAMFRNCTNMIRTPKLVNHNLRRNGNNGDNFNNMFTNCINLEYVDGLEFYDTSYGLDVRWQFNFSTCPKLRYLILGNVGGAINLRNCLELDIPTLYATLMRQTRFGNRNAGGGFANQGLVIEGTVYDALVSTYSDFEPYLQSWTNRFVDIIRH